MSSYLFLNKNISKFFTLSSPSDAAMKRRCWLGTLLPHSSSYNLTLLLSRVLIGRYLTFCSLTSSTCCNSPPNCAPLKRKRGENSISNLLLRLRETRNALELPVFFFFSFLFLWLCQRYPEYQEIRSKKYCY